MSIGVSLIAMCDCAVSKINTINEVRVKFRFIDKNDGGSIDLVELYEGLVRSFVRFMRMVAHCIVPSVYHDCLSLKTIPKFFEMA